MDEVLVNESRLEDLPNFDVTNGADDMQVEGARLDGLKEPVITEAARIKVIPMTKDLADQLGLQEGMSLSQQLEECEAEQIAQLWDQFDRRFGVVTRGSVCAGHGSGDVCPFARSGTYADSNGVA